MERDSRRSADALPRISGCYSGSASAMNRSPLTRDCIRIRPIFGGYYRNPRYRGATEACDLGLALEHFTKSRLSRALPSGPQISR